MCKLTEEACKKLAEDVGQPFSLGADCSVHLIRSDPGLIGGFLSDLMSSGGLVTHGLTVAHGGISSPTPLGYLVVFGALFVAAFVSGYLIGRRSGADDDGKPSRIEPRL
ncbi:hypothetical protein O9X98_10325 [Agrobacterium salinitolerans]|nr:hypothetical protein [Agrobacterium salinitolerans]